MSIITPTSLGEKLKFIRTAQGISQENVARAIKKNKSDISRIENGQAEPSDATLQAIRRFLGVDNAPLLPLEQERYKDRLLIWEDLLEANRNAEARAMQPEMARILILPYEHDLIVQYMMLDIRLRIKENDMSGIVESLDEAEPLLDKVGNKARYGYHNIKGFMYMSSNPDSALEHYSQALELLDKNDVAVSRILGNIGLIYAFKGKYHHAIQYFERAENQYSGSRANPIGVQGQAQLAFCYHAVGANKKAKKLVDLSVPHAISLNNAHLLVLLYNTLAGINMEYGDFTTALENFDQSIATVERAAQSYLHAHEMRQIYVGLILNKVLCLVKMNNLDDCNALIEQARHYVQDNETLATMLETATHITTLADPASLTYLEDTAIPYFLALKPHGTNEVISICRLLATHYKKKKSKTKLAYIKAIL